MKHYYWFNGGIGASTAGYSGGAGFSYEFSGNGLFSIRSIYNNELNKGGIPYEKIWEIGALCGRRIIKSSECFVALSTGISFVRVINRGELISGGGLFVSPIYEKLVWSTFGIPIEGQLFWWISSYNSFFFNVFANLNMEKSFCGFLIGFSIGKLR